jgi:hypothetical protein
VFLEGTHYDRVVLANNFLIRNPENPLREMSWTPGISGVGKEFVIRYYRPPWTNELIEKLPDISPVIELSAN